MSNDSAQSESDAITTRRVWDLPVRIFHWLLVLSVIGAYVTNQLGVEYFKYHLWCGYSVMVLVSFRILWGVVGTYHARFWNFVRGPITTLRYGVDTLKGKTQHYAGHNPLGAVMVVVLLLTLLTQALTGLVSNDEILNLGPLYGYVTDAFSLQMTSLHRNLFYWIVGLVLLHILAVVFHRVFKGEDLIKAMFTGKKPADFVSESETISSSRLWLALLVLAVVIATLAWFVIHAPPPPELSFD